jgi:hypothetical protein
VHRRVDSVKSKIQKSIRIHPSSEDRWQSDHGVFRESDIGRIAGEEESNFLKGEVEKSSWTIGSSGLWIIDLTTELASSGFEG